MLLTEEDIRVALPVIKGTKVLTCQLEVAPEATLFALKTAKQHGGLGISIKHSFNSSSVVSAFAHGAMGRRIDPS